MPKIQVKEEDLVEVIENFLVYDENYEQKQILAGARLIICEVDEREGDVAINTEDFDWPQNIWISPRELSKMKKIISEDMLKLELITEINLPPLHWKKDLKYFNENGIFERTLDETIEETEQKLKFTEEDLKKQKQDKVDEFKFESRFKPSPYTKTYKMRRSSKKLQRKAARFPMHLTLPKFVKKSKASQVLILQNEAEAAPAKKSLAKLKKKMKIHSRFSKSVKGKTIKQEMKFEEHYKKPNGGLGSEMLYKARQTSKMANLYAKKQKKRSRQLPMIFNDRSFLSAAPVDFDINNRCVTESFLKQLDRIEDIYNHKLLEISRIPAL